MDKPLETTETFKRLSREACQQSSDWIPLPEGKAYQCQRTDVHVKVIAQFINDHRDQIKAWTEDGRCTIRGPFCLERGANVDGFIIPLLEENPASAVEEPVRQPVVILRSSEHGAMDISARWRSCVFPFVRGDRLLVLRGGVKFLLLQQSVENVENTSKAIKHEPQEDFKAIKHELEEDFKAVKHEPEEDF